MARLLCRRAVECSSLWTVEWRPFGMAFTASERSEQAGSLSFLSFRRGRKTQSKQSRKRVSSPFRSPLGNGGRSLSIRRNDDEAHVFFCKSKDAQPFSRRTCSAAAKTLLHVIRSPKGAPVARAVLIDGCKGTAKPACLPACLSSLVPSSPPR